MMDLKELKEDLILTLDNGVTSAKSENLDTLEFVSKCFTDTEDFNKNKEALSNLINDIQNTYNNDGYVLYKWDFGTEAINNRKNMYLLVCTIYKIKTPGEKIKGKVENNLNRIIRKSRMMYDVLDSYKDSEGFNELELLTKNADEILAKCMLVMSDIDTKRNEENK